MSDLLDAATLASGLALIFGAVAWGFWVWAIFGPTSPDKVRLRVEALADPTAPFTLAAHPLAAVQPSTEAKEPPPRFVEDARHTRITSWLSAANEAARINAFSPNLPPVHPVDVLHMWARAEDVARSLTRKV